MTLDPAVVRALTEAGIAMPEQSPDPDEQRRLAFEYEKALFPHIGLSRVPIRTHDRTVTVEGYPSVPVRLYYPAESSPHARLPVCLFFFGGSFIQGGLHHPAVDAQCARRAAEAGVVVAAVSYALAPEHPFPTALEQGYAALDFLAGAGDQLGLDPTRLAVWGQSAGATLAAGSTLINRERAHHRLALQILEVPLLDLAEDPADRDLDEVTEAELAALGTINRWYLQGADPRDPHVSPLRATDLRGLPPAYIVTAELDPLRHDGARYATALAQAGVPVSAVQMLGLPHNGSLFEGVSLTARTVGAGIVAALRTLHR
ncbi:alpha/beta hydrolase [Nocardia sp. NPDC058176]|uniref:alpha/beta hydrolase n=1 Tax=Nocardia sp. NPDC058176 TaxID=3346368 RepID=UPI0036DDB57B